MNDECTQISELLGFTLSAVERDEVYSQERFMAHESIVFTRTDGVQVGMYHVQDCCEQVWVEEIHGDLQALVGYPLTTAEVYTRDGDKDDQMFTFYRIGNERHMVTIRWCGESEYYSIAVRVEVVK